MKSLFLLATLALALVGCSGEAGGDTSQAAKDVAKAVTPGSEGTVAPPLPPGGGGGKFGKTGTASAQPATTGG